MPAAIPHDTSRPHVISQRACGFMLGGIVPIGMESRYQEGYDGLIAQARGEYVTDVKVQEMLRYAFVGWRFCAVFEATAYPQAGSAVDGQTALDRIEKLHQEGRLSDTEYQDLRKRALERMTGTQ